MRLISIVASHPIKTMIGAELIMYELGTNYSHVSYIFWNSDRTKPRYYECVLNGGVKFTGQNFWEGRNQTVFRKDFEVTDEIYAKFLDSAMDKCGESYGLLQDLGIKISEMFRLAKNIFSSSTYNCNCSELVYDFADYVGLKNIPQSDPDLVTPKDIVEACRG